MSSTVEQIKSRLNIVDVVQTYVKLQKAGANFKANCPFHQERTPSFFISPARDSWHCFGCSRGGDIFSFVMEMEGIEFIEALKILADRAGVEIEKIDRQKENERLKLIRLLEDAGRFYQVRLKNNQSVIEYLKNRGMKGETAKIFAIGFAPDGWRNLHDFLKTKGYTALEMEKAGMIIKTQSCYDRFRNRIMFPLADSSGRIVGFTGRIFGQETPEAGGKYINTPQTVLYDKSRLLYAFDKAKNEIRKKDACVLVEGQMDAIMSHQAGLTNAVAVSGTAFTAEHLKLIGRLTKNIIISFDKDTAGVNAAGRGIGLALAEGFDVKVATIPSGKDPADTVLDNPKNWLAAVENSKNIIEFMLEIYSGSKEVEANVLPFISKLPGEMEKAQWVKKVADKLKIAEEPVWRQLKKTKIEIEPAKKEESPPSSGWPGARTRLDFLTEKLAGLIMLKIKSEDEELKKIAEKAALKCKDFLNKLNKEEKDKIILEAELFYEGSASLEEEFVKLEKELEKEKIKFELEELTRKIKEIEIGDNDYSQKEIKLKEYLGDFHSLTKKLNEIK